MDYEQKSFTQIILNLDTIHFILNLGGTVFHNYQLILFIPEVEQFCFLNFEHSPKIQVCQDYIVNLGDKEISLDY